MNSQLRQKRLGGSCRRSFALCTEIVRILPLPLVCCRLQRRERRHSSAQEGPPSEALYFSCREVQLYLVGLPTRTRPPECLLGSGRSQADTYDRLRKVDQFTLKKQHRFESEKGFFFSVCRSANKERKNQVGCGYARIGIPVIAYCADEQGDEETGSERETDAGRGAQESIGARSPGEGAPNRGDEAWAAQVPQPSTSSSWSGSWIEKWLFSEVSSAAQNEQQQGEGALFQPTHTHEEQPPAPAEPPEDLLKKEIIGIMGGLYPANPWDPENPLIRERLFPGGIAQEDRYLDVAKSTRPFVMASHLWFGGFREKGVGRGRREAGVSKERSEGMKGAKARGLGPRFFFPKGSGQWRKNKLLQNQPLLALNGVIFKLSRLLG
ncbi:hypothetical protein VNO77_19598 [Canavalia gladiata]|uniref:Uncharacterized protein n=1 Tax=Canavalia gladiata TaxID=3824 RepID=A0AAN9LR82_CANGL